MTSFGLFLGHGQLARFCAEGLLNRSFNIQFAFFDGFGTQRGRSDIGVEQPSENWSHRFLKHQIPIIYSQSFTSQVGLLSHLRSFQVSILLSICFPKKISVDYRKCATRWALNLHPSLLPAYRGPTPIDAQQFNRESTTGVSIHVLTDEFDAGPIISQVKFAMPDIDTESLNRHYADYAVQMLLETDWTNLNSKAQSAAL